jgi:hypothetical protein
MNFLVQLRTTLAKLLDPEMSEMSDRYLVLLEDVREMRDTVGKEIPEVKMATQWILGKNNSDTLSRKINPSSKHGPSFKLYNQYKSLVHFRDVLVNDYKRKLKVNENAKKEENWSD